MITLSMTDSVYMLRLEIVVLSRDIMEDIIEWLHQLGFAVES